MAAFIVQSVVAFVVWAMITVDVLVAHAHHLILTVLFQITQMKIKHNPFAKAFLPGQDKDKTVAR